VDFLSLLTFLYSLLDVAFQFSLLLLDDGTSHQFCLLSLLGYFAGLEFVDNFAALFCLAFKLIDYLLVFLDLLLIELHILCGLEVLSLDELLQFDLLLR
jgi:hypothetical protein